MAWCTSKNCVKYKQWRKNSINFDFSIQMKDKASFLAKLEIF